MIKLKNVKNINDNNLEDSGNEESRFKAGSSFVFKVLANNILDNNLVCERIDDDKAYMVFPFKLKNIKKSNLEYKYKVHQEYDANKKSFKLLTDCYIGFSIAELNKIALDNDVIVSLEDKSDDETMFKLKIKEIADENKMDKKIRNRHM